MAHQSRTAMRSLLALMLLCTTFGLAAAPVRSDTIVDRWSTVTAPTPPPLKPVTVDPKTTALLVLDLIKQTCNPENRPACMASLAPVAKLIAGARASKTMIVYSIIPGPSTIADVQPAVAPAGGEPMVKAGPDKFIGTDLEKILRDKGITTVIVTGTSAIGAVLQTASHAAGLGFKTIVPVDGMSADVPYAMQLTTWDLANAPTLSPNITLTAINMVSF
jgi:nicotinamidase-related amidase